MGYALGFWLMVWLVFVGVPFIVISLILCEGWPCHFLLVVWCVFYTRIFLVWG